jgi:hypothetical protein
VRVPDPEAVTENVAVPSTAAVWPVGWMTIVGGTAVSVSVTVTVAAVLVRVVLVQFLSVTVT